MKRLILSLALLGGLSVQGQVCTRTGSFVGTDVSVVGTADLVQTGSTISIELGSDFVSDAGPDLDVYLSEESHPLATGIKLEALTNLSGAQSYSVPNGVLITDYDYIVVHCTQYNHLYGYALLGSATGNCSVALNTEDKQLEGVKLIQTPQGIKIQSDLQLTNAAIQIVDINGKVIVNSRDITSSLSIPSNGIYFVNIRSEEGNFNQKIIQK
jgi:hypothetical protein